MLLTYLPRPDSVLPGRLQTVSRYLGLFLEIPSSSSTASVTL